MQLCSQRGAELTQAAGERDLANQLLSEAAEASQQTLAENEKAQETLQQEITSAVERVRAELEDELNRSETLLAEAQKASTNAALGN